MLVDRYGSSSPQFSLDEIRDCLDTAEFSPSRVIDMHVARLREQIDEQRRLVGLLETLKVSFRADSSASADDFIHAIECITMIEKAFTPDELRELKARGERLGADHIRAAEAEWPQLIAKVRAEMARGTDPTSEQIRPLAERWRELVREFTGGSPVIEQKVRALYASDPKLVDRTNLDPQLFAYVNAAIRAL